MNIGILSFCFIYGISKSPDSEKCMDLLFINDIHLDPKYYQYGNPYENLCRDKPAAINKSYPFGQYECDTPIQLFSSLMNSLPGLVKNPDMILLGGDYIAHQLGYGWEEMENVIRYVFDSISLIYPNSPILMTPGNNDFPISYGSFDDDKNDFGHLYSQFAKYINQSQYSTLKKGIFHYYDVPNQELRILFINSVIYAKKRDKLESESDPYGQFEWIKDSIKDALLLNYKIGFVMHISPGVDNFNFKQKIHSSYMKKMLSIIDKYPIEFILVGHSHKDFIIPLMDQKKHNVFSLSAPSVSPSDSTNPGFRVYSFCDGHLVNYKQYSANILQNPLFYPTWKLSYEFQQAYNVDKISHSTLQNIIHSIQTNPYISCLYYNLIDNTTPFDIVQKHCQEIS